MIQKLRDALVRRAKDERGFTLVELLMVMVIIGVLAGLGFTGFNSLQKRSSRTQADVYWRDLNTAVRMHQVEGFGFPESVQALITKGYLDDETSPWNTTGGELATFPTAAANVSDTGPVWALGGPDNGKNVCVWMNGVSSGLNPDAEGQCPKGPAD